jgi:hypothetical protein
MPGPFLGNGSVNTFPLLSSNGRVVFSTWSMPRPINETMFGAELVDSSVYESVKRGLEPETEE